MSELLDQLNEPQREAASCTEGPVMIIAGAGSGKTRTLTYRIAHLIEKGVDSFSILALTFTNKAAAEMKERIIQLVGSEARNIWMGTFHSVFARILRSEASRIGYIPTFTIYDNEDSKSAIKQILKNLNLDPKTYNPGYVLSRISMAKSNLISPEEYAQNPEIQQTDHDSHKPLIGQIYTIYNQRLRNAMAMDFDDLLFNTNLLLRNCPDILLKYQNRFRYILVDEYQDTNYSQYLIVKKLAARHQNICVVGDDAQSIYAFRGANIQNILNFRRDYPTLNLFKLEQNYRSTQNIVEAANSIISNNKDQIPKTIWTDNGKGSRIRLLRSTDERDEARQIAESIINARLDNDLNYKDFAILYRTNVQSRALEEALRRLNIPYRIYAGISFYGRKEIKDILAYLRLAVNPHDDESLIRIINYPARGIGNTTMDRVRLAASDNGVSIFTLLENLKSLQLGISPNVCAKIEDFTTMLKVFNAQAPTTDAYTLAKQIVYKSGIITMLKNDDDPDNPNRIENIEELLNGIKEFCDSPDFIPGSQNTLDQFLQQVLLMTSEDKDKSDPDKVSLMTIHAAKGLEFPSVFVAGMEENLFPSSLSITSRQELEEERRLFYVAVTRAMQQLTLSYALTRYQYGNSSCQEISRFVGEISPQYIEMPRIRKDFPSIGTLPPAFRNVGKPQVPPRQFHKAAPAAGSSKDTKAERNGKNYSGISEAGIFTNRSVSEGHEHRLLKSNGANTEVSKGQGPALPPSDIDAIQPGATVLHAKFGTGKVLTIEGSGPDRKAIIQFETAGQKQLLLKFAKLTLLP